MPLAKSVLPALSRLAAALFVATLALAGPAAAAGKADVRVSQQGALFVIDATLEAPVPPALAWEVLTDFEQMDRYVPNLAESRVVRRDGNVVVILQHGIARFGPLSLRFESEREVVLDPPASIRSVQRRGTMEKLQSLTTFAPSPGGTRLDYHVEVIPGALFPDALTRRFLGHEIEEQFAAIVREMVRRAGPRG